MPLPLEGYAIIGDTQTAALVGADGSIDWLCLPRFDSDACFSALLGDPGNGRWFLGPADGGEAVSRRYLPGTLVLETEFQTADGTARVVDFMPIRDRDPEVIRIVQGVRGSVTMRMALDVRFGYGAVSPWLREDERGVLAIGGPDAVYVCTTVGMQINQHCIVAEFTVSEGDQIPFVLTWHPSTAAPPPPVIAETALQETIGWWEEWSGRCTYEGPCYDLVQRSLITLKALTYAPTGAVIAAATTSVPSVANGIRNWDYRYCWLRDATLTLYSLLLAGYQDEARAWRNWLLRSVAGDPAQLQIMYGISGERRLTEIELPWLPGYEGARPVRIGNAAHRQLQLDVYGEVMDVLYQARRAGLETNRDGWLLERAMIEYLETVWHKPDEGIWEVRGPSRHFTHSKVMTWVAMDRAVRAVEQFGLDGPVERWRVVRAKIHDEVCQQGYDAGRNTFTQYYGGTDLDASLLLIPTVGFLPPDDPRVIGTVEAVRRELSVDGFIIRYPTDKKPVDGLPPGEGVFLPCTFWYADALALLGRHEEAEEVFQRLLGLCNDVGLLSEVYDTANRRLLGNFPQAFSHVALINTAHTLAPRPGPVELRESTTEPT